MKASESILYLKTTKDIAGKSTCTAKDNNKEGIDRLYIVKCKVPVANRPVLYKIQQMYNNRKNRFKMNVKSIFSGILFYR